MSAENLTSDQSATPLTDAAVCEFESNHPQYRELVTADFARQLERQVATLERSNKRLREKLDRRNT